MMVYDSLGSREGPGGRGGFWMENVLPASYVPPPAAYQPCYAPQGPSSLRTAPLPPHPQPPPPSRYFPTYTNPWLSRVRKPKSRKPCPTLWDRATINLSYITSMKNKLN